MKRLLCLLLLSQFLPFASMHAQSGGADLQKSLVNAYEIWRGAMMKGDAQGWAGSITQYRQVVVRNQIVSEKRRFPDAVFETGVKPPALDGLRLLEAEAVGKTAHLVYFGPVDMGQDVEKLPDSLLKLKFGFENGGWKYDSNRFTSLDHVPEVRKSLQEGKRPDFLDSPEYTPPGALPPVPPLCRVPDHKAGYKLQSFGYETRVRMNGFTSEPVEDALDQQIITGGLVNGANEITLITRPVPPPEGQKAALQIRVYKLAQEEGKPGVEVFRWEAPEGIAPREITLPFTVK
ncbi:MAG: hypothetical protein HS117_24145 [Verrucomicrobiaceae bacterium]|jgi:hypothetical protein|nr:hypothetical protein [Verrucomicrobiaceae bacterium]